MLPRSIGIVGYGHFGELLHELIERFAPQIKLRVHSSRFAPDGKVFFSLADTAQCDAFILAVPISAFEEQLMKILPLMRPEGVIVDVATVKMHTVKALERHAAGRQYLATHPMWGRE